MDFCDTGKENNDRPKQWVSKEDSESEETPKETTNDELGKYKIGMKGEEIDKDYTTNSLSDHANEPNSK